MFQTPEPYYHGSGPLNMLISHVVSRVSFPFLVRLNKKILEIETGDSIHRNLIYGKIPPVTVPNDRSFWAKMTVL